MFDLNSPEVLFAVSTVRQATALVQTIQSELVTPALTKNDRSPVTMADYSAQALVGYLIEEHYPGDPLVGEEDSTSLQQAEQREMLKQVTDFVKRQLPHANPNLICRWIDRGSAESGQRFWTVDPIDGTKGFLRGDQYAIALALVIHGQVQVGVLGCPNLSKLVFAVRGQGTWSTPLDEPGASITRLHVSGQSNVQQARVLKSVEAGHTNVDKIDELVQHLAIQVAPVSMDSQAKYAVLAAGEGEVLLRLISEKQTDYKEKIWDQAAGSLVIEEAGGTITDLDGTPLDFNQGRTLAKNRGITATNSALHPLVLAGLKAIGA